MIDRVVGNELLPVSIKQDIVERSDGIPLFVEEITKAVLEAESEGAAERAVAVIPSPSVAVPASLHASLMARLDRLGPAKEVAQIGAAIGREFSHSLLVAVVRKPEVELNSALDRLIAAGLLFRQGVPPNATYLFKHVMVQDAAYGTLLREPRRALHAHIAHTLETQFAETTESQPELLARHCTEAGLIGKAANLWARAGQRSLERSALGEASEQLRRALELIATLPSTPEIRREQIKLQVALITQLIHVKGYSALETKTAVEQSRQLIEQAEARGEAPEDSLLFLSTLYGAWAANFVAFNGKTCSNLATQFLAVADKQATTSGRLVAHRMMGHTLVLGGDFAQARRHYEEAIALYNPVEHRQLAMRFGQDIMTTVLSYYSLALWSLGYPEKGLRYAKQAVEVARETGHAASLMFAFYMASLFHISCRNYSLADEFARELLMVADQKGAVLWKASSLIYQGCVAKPADAVALMTAGIASYRSTGATALLTVFLSYLGRAYADLGQFDDAWRCIDEASSIIKTAEEKIWEAEVNRISGEITMLCRPMEATKAEQYLTNALAAARRQHAKSLELRAAMSLARLRRSQGKTQQARELLAPVYGWFTEGFDTCDLKEAKALLEELA
jgi:predicted ATPase